MSEKIVFYACNDGLIIQENDDYLLKISENDAKLLRDFLLGLYPIQKSIAVDMQMGNVMDGSSVVGLVIDNL